MSISNQFLYLSMFEKNYPLKKKDISSLDSDSTCTKNKNKNIKITLEKWINNYISL